MTKRKIVLFILDGWGIAPAWGGNAIEMAQTPNMDEYWRKFPHTTLKAAENAVGLPVHEMGNSEVGHLNLGCGQIAYQNLTGISQTIEDGTFFDNKTLVQACDHVKKNQSTLHLLGLLSDGGIHSHINHLFALLELAKKQQITKVNIHIITDGRDTDPMKAYSYVNNLKTKMTELGLGKIVSIMGRFYAMDRDKHWDRTAKSYNCLFFGQAPVAQSAEKAIAENYRQNKTDEFIEPTLLVEPNQAMINSNDALIFYNFRADRTRQLIQSMVSPNFKGFRTKNLENFYFASFSFLEEYLHNPKIKQVFELRQINYSLARILSENNLTQLHIAETEKYAHVTFFFNGGKETLPPGEDHHLVYSPRVKTFDLKPEMSAKEIKDQVLNKFEKYDFTVCNFANADMVGHSGNIKATVRACETVDKCLGELIKTILAKGHIAIITADHGNAEQMLNPNNGEPYTEHTTNPVPFILCANDPELQKPLKNDTNLKLSDVAPTILDLFALEKPAEMTGQSILLKGDKNEA